MFSYLYITLHSSPLNQDCVLERSGSVNRKLAFLFDWPLTSAIILLRKTILKTFFTYPNSKRCVVTCSINHIKY